MTKNKNQKVSFGKNYGKEVEVKRKSLDLVIIENQKEVVTTIQIDQKFIKSKLSSLYKEMAEMIKQMIELQAGDSEIKFHETDYMAIQIILLVKYFTNIDFSKYNENLEGLIDAYQYHMDNDHIELILNTFDENELKKIFEQTTKIFKESTSEVHNLLQQEVEIQSKESESDEVQ